MRRYGWVLSPLLAIAGYVLVGYGAQCEYRPGVFGMVQPRYDYCTVEFLGMILKRPAAGWLAALIGAAAGASLAYLIYRTRSGVS